MPVRITLTRVAPRSLDPFDNLPASLKPVADGVADALGIDDRSPLLRFDARQRKGEAREYAVEISIQTEAAP